MPVSRMERYGWDCPSCHRRAEAPSWRIVDARERPQVIATLSVGLVHVVCPTCGTSASVGRPVLIIRPGEVVPLLVGLSEQELREEDLSARASLFEEATSSDDYIPTDDLTGWHLVVPRELLALIVSRDTASDLESPTLASSDIAQYAPHMVSWYETFLSNVIEGLFDSKVGQALDGLWRTSPDDLQDFLSFHPELASDTALQLAQNHLRLGPPAGESDLPLRARLDLVVNLRKGVEIGAVAAQYLQSINSFGAAIIERRDGLLAGLDEAQASDRVSRLEEVLSITNAMGDTELAFNIANRLAQELLRMDTPAAAERAFALLEGCLDGLDAESPDWPVVAGNLGAAYMGRAEGDSRENWNRAHDLLNLACARSDREADPRTWAINLSNLGFLYARRPGGTKDDLETAIRLTVQSLDEKSPDRDVVDWAYSQLNLGLAFRWRADEGDDLEARRHYEAALERLKPEDDQNLWLTLHNNLADVLLDLTPPELEAASAGILDALAKAEGAPPNVVARLHWIEARVQRSRVGSEAPETVDALRRALSVATPASAPYLHISIGRELADVLARLNDWTGTADTYESIIAAQNYLYTAQLYSASRAEVLANGSRLARWASYSLAKAGRLERAIEVIEEGRARQLSEAVGRDVAEWTELAAIDELLATSWRAAIEEFRVAAALTDGSTASPDSRHSDDILQAERRIRQLSSEIRNVPGFENFLKPLTLEGIRLSGNGKAIAYIVNAPAGSFIMVVPAAPDAPIEATEVSKITSMDVLSLVLLNIEDPSRLGLMAAQMGGVLSRLRHLPIALSRLNELTPLVSPLIEYCRRHGVNSIVVIPTGLLSAVPFYAVPCDEEGHIVDDLCDLRLAPSAALYSASRKRAEILGERRFVGMADSRSDSPLPGSRVEVELIASLSFFESTRTAVGEDATREWFSNQVRGASHIHLACHGGSTLASDSGGTIQLAGGADISINGLASDGLLDGCHLAVASACQSGHIALSGDPDDFVGLAAGFMLAGAASAITSLWQVDDTATVLLMLRLYRELTNTDSHGKPQEPSAALRSARQWLRRLTVGELNTLVDSEPSLSALFGDELEQADFQHLLYAAPVYWAAFACYGH